MLIVAVAGLRALYRGAIGSWLSNGFTDFLPATRVENSWSSSISHDTSVVGQRGHC